MNNQTEEQWRLRVAKAEAWDEGYAACKNEWSRYNQGMLGGRPENPYDRLVAPLRFRVNEDNRPTKTPRSVIQEVVTYD